MKGDGESKNFDQRWPRPFRLAVGLCVLGNNGQNPSWEVFVAWFLEESFSNMTSCSITTKGADDFLLMFFCSNESIWPFSVSMAIS